MKLVLLTSMNMIQYRMLESPKMYTRILTGQVHFLVLEPLRPTPDSSVMRMLPK